MGVDETREKVRQIRDEQLRILEELKEARCLFGGLREDRVLELLLEMEARYAQAFDLEREAHLRQLRALEDVIIRQQAEVEHAKRSARR